MPWSVSRSRKTELFAGNQNGILSGCRFFWCRAWRPSFGLLPKSVFIGTSFHVQFRIVLATLPERQTIAGNKEATL
jgi:hypothetical protein